MSATVHLALFGWPLIVIVLFGALPRRRAVLASMVGAWLFLPMAGYKIAGLPDITKMSMACLGVLAGTWLFGMPRRTRLRWNIADLAMLAWVLSPIPTGFSTGYGVYEGLSQALGLFIAWGLPYLIGRLYFGDWEGMRELALAIFIGGLLYLPLVLIELRLSPQLHTWVYGFHQHIFSQTKRGGGWRPTVFMQHGLAVAMFMGTAALCGLWLWTAGRMRVLGGVPLWLLALSQLTVALACKSLYALLLMLAGTGILLVTRAFNTKVAVVALLVIAPAYVTARTVGGWDAGQLRTLAERFSEDRGESMGVRLDSEDALVRWLGSDWIVGKGRLSGLLDADPSTYGRFIPDGFWLIALGRYGILGLVGMLGVLLLPAWLHLRRHTPYSLVSPPLAGATVLMVVLILYALDNLLNAMVNPIFLLAAGGLVECTSDTGRRPLP